MDWFPMLINACWGGLFAAGLGVMLTTPSQGLLPCFACGMVGRLVRNLLIAGGLSQAASVAMGAIACVLVATLFSRRFHLTPLAMVTGVLPLGAAVPLFRSIHGILTLHRLQGEALSEAVVQLIANLSNVFTTTLAIVLGIWLGLLILKVLGRKDLLLRSSP
ncbi:MAG TPA: threonine/serine exporter family protein [Leptolyngbyaceae cyanobacterium M33_DOE_097]|uniref:Threonine/Serine exporter ThrE domain-containing protein n=1 Tax=Oscillatoriales cyanobacterium SpSt-418 TaxID=2282169 RepID=A0A7C3PSE9_9CYAN|nr:threonine/serine exporter family protein [Leptolyngbyaceae cyanobacterium M33_DOE_097]